MEARFNKHLGVLFVSFLCINTANAGFVDWLWSSSPSAKKVPALVCKYMDEDYSRQVIDPVVVFGPKTYNLNFWEQKILNYDSQGGFEVYNNRYKTLPPMSLTGGVSVTMLYLNGVVLRPHHAGILSKKPTEIINGDWTLKKNWKCKSFSPKLLKKVFPEITNDRQMAGLAPEAWTLSRKGNHRDLELFCIWQIIKLPPEKPLDADKFDPLISPEEEESQEVQLPRNFSVVEDGYDPSGNYSVVTGDECPLTNESGDFVNPEDKFVS